MFFLFIVLGAIPNYWSPGYKTKSFQSYFTSVAWRWSQFKITANVWKKRACVKTIISVDFCESIKVDLWLSRKNTFWGCLRARWVGKYLDPREINWHIAQWGTPWFYSSPNVIRIITQRKMRWAGHVARMGRWEVRIKFCLGAWEEEGTRKT